MGRTLETARIIAAPHDLEPQTDPDLREIDYGRWEGKTRDEVETEFPTNTTPGRRTR
jgi:broad specificity phosphatase PhoE